MLRTREPITLRSLVAGTSVSTMAVYTHFGGMDGMWKALRQEGFTRLATRLAQVTPSADPVRDLTALIAAYLGNALDHPDLYRVMFDANFDLEDAQAADDTLEYLVQAAERGRRSRPLPRRHQPTRTGHPELGRRPRPGLPRRHRPPTPADPRPRPLLLTTLSTATGDDPDRCARSVESGWQPRLAGE